MDSWNSAHCPALLQLPNPGVQLGLPPNHLIQRFGDRGQAIFVGHVHTVGLYTNYTRNSTAMSDSGFPLPPPTFEFLVFSLKTQTEMKLGLISFGAEEGEKEQPDLLAARHVIDMLAMIQEKTKGNLSLEEQRLIENSLTELRFRFVQVSETVGKSKPVESADAETAS